jgi:hypothetical protein
MVCHNIARIVFALSCISLGMTNAFAQDTRIYKCAQPNGGVLYTDQACNGGTVLDIRLDPVDPDALTRLARAGAEFDAAEAQRKAEQARLEELNRLQQQMESERYAGVPFAADGNYFDGEPWYGYGPWYGSSDGYGGYDSDRYHRRPARNDRARMGEESRAASHGAVEHSGPERR